MTPLITVVGSSNVDLIMKMDRLPKRGESITGAEFMQVFGGKGANQAVAAARAGGSVAFVNCVGDDSYGQSITANMKNAGIQTDFVFVESRVASGTALIMVGGQGENYLSIAPGANYRLSRAHLDQAAHTIQNAALVVLQYEILEDTLYYAIDLAHSAGKPVMFNLAPAQSFREEYLGKIDYFLANETETETLVGFPVDSTTAIELAAQALLAKGPRTVIITLGAGGSYVANADVCAFVPAFPVKAVDTTAAGDVFAGSLAVALVEGKPLLDGVRFASAASAIAVTRLGAQTSIPTRDEIEAFLSAAI
jgi:ribokinase